MRMPKIVSDLFMGPDGETWAIGRVVAPTAFTPLGVPFMQVLRNQPVDLAALAVLIGGCAAAFMMMVRGTHNTEPPGPDGLSRPVNPAPPAV